MNISTVRELITAPADGSDAVSYMLAVSPSVVTLSEGTPSVQSVVISAYRTKGSGTPEAFTGIITTEWHYTDGDTETRSKECQRMVLQDGGEFSVLTHIDVKLGAQGVSGALATATVAFINSGSDSVRYYMTVSPKTVKVNSLVPSADSIDIRVFKSMGSQTPVASTDCRVKVTATDKTGCEKETYIEGKSSASYDISGVFAEMESIALELEYCGVTVQTEKVEFLNSTPRIPIPEGIYSDDKTYVCNQYKTPLVYHAGKFYYLIEEGEVTGTDPAMSVDDADGVWAEASQYQLVVAQMLLADYAKLGAAVFYGNYMISQYGTDAEGKVSSDYSSFAAGTFSPNLSIDFVNGVINASKGVYAGGIKTDFVTVDPSDAGFELGDMNNIMYDAGVISSFGRHTVVLPSSSENIGRHVSAYNPYTHLGATETRLVCEDGSSIRGILANAGEIYDTNKNLLPWYSRPAVEYVDFNGGVIEMLGVPGKDEQGNRKCDWVLVGQSALFVQAYGG